MSSFVKAQRAAQARFRQASTTLSAPARECSKPASGYSAMLLPKELRSENLFPEIREDALAYFAHHRIAWHQWSHHLLSSQACCLNFLMPFTTEPNALASLLRPLLGEVEMLPLEDDRLPGRDAWHVGFEWIGERDHLNEGVGKDATRRRGANCTSADAAVKYRRLDDGSVGMLLIEWKYTETYGSPPDLAKEPTRRKRYTGIAFVPDGPVRSDAGLDLADLFWEPFYQFLRQQMLAHRMQAVREEGCDHVGVLHIAPGANTAFKVVTAPALCHRGTDAVRVWGDLLVQPNAFRSVNTEKLFGCFDVTQHPQFSRWWDYVCERYPGLVGRAG
ncbi:PGN_0703 family putative restriction endonuclease [Azospirillum oleiclasticum]